MKNNNMKLIMESFGHFLNEQSNNSDLEKWLNAVKANLAKAVEGEGELNESMLADFFQIMTDGVAYMGLGELIFGYLSGIAVAEREKLKKHLEDFAAQNLKQNPEEEEEFARQTSGINPFADRGKTIERPKGMHPDMYQTYRETHDKELVTLLSDFFTEARRGFQTLGIYTILKKVLGDYVENSRVAVFVDVMTLITAIGALLNDGILANIQQKIKGKGIVAVIKSIFKALFTFSKGFGAWLSDLLKAFGGAADSKAFIKLAIKAARPLFSGMKIAAKTMGQGAIKGIKPIARQIKKIPSELKV